MRTRTRLSVVTAMFVTVSATVLGTVAAATQVKTEVPAVVPQAKPVTVERITVHGAALDGNLEGNAVDRDVLVLLPPSYARERSRRYPVVYGLHGYSIGAEQWAKEIDPGTHTSAVAVRFQNHVLPFFSSSLCADTKCR